MQLTISSDDRPTSVYRAVGTGNADLQSYIITARPSPIGSTKPDWHDNGAGEARVRFEGSMSYHDIDCFEGLVGFEFGTAIFSKNYSHIFDLMLIILAKYCPKFEMHVTKIYCNILSFNWRQIQIRAIVKRSKVFSNHRNP